MECAASTSREHNQPQMQVFCAATCTLVNFEKNKCMYLQMHSRTRTQCMWSNLLQLPQIFYMRCDGAFHFRTFSNAFSVIAAAPIDIAVVANTAALCHYRWQDDVSSCEQAIKITAATTLRQSKFSVCFV